MEQEIQKLIDNNDILKKYLDYPKQELKMIRMLINLKLITFFEDDKKIENARMIRLCFNESCNFLEFILSFRNKVETSSVSTVDTVQNIKKRNVCEFCNGKTCIKKSAITLIKEIDTYNSINSKEITYLSVIDYILNRKAPEFKSIPDKKFFASADLIDLMFVQLILESDLIILKNIDEKSQNITFEYLDLMRNSNNDYYINILLDYYKNEKRTEQLTLNINDFDKIFKEKNDYLRIYQIAAYYKYLIEIEKVDVIIKLRDILKPENIERGTKIRAQYFVYKYFNKVKELPYSKKTKDKIFSILNYILNYRYKEETVFIPINILIFSNDKEGVEKISRIIGEFMWFFGYLPENMNYYDEYMNKIILDKFLIQKMYYNEGKKKEGVLLLHNFENLLYTDYMQQNLILNILTDEMEKNNKPVCTIIYGEREMIKQVIGNHHKLSQMLINLELEIDDLDIDKIYELVISKLEKNIDVPDTIKEKIYNYIKATYIQSDIKNMEYVNKLYNSIVLNLNSKFSIKKKNELSIKNIPEAYNTRDLTTIMKDINDLVGLEQIKEQINDLVALLKFNKKANIDINNFNLHMVFSGNPGTGKTTVARLIKDIFYNLGYISQNKITEVTAKDLIAEYVGQTSGKTYNVVKSALGGVLFIDEAYAITTGEDSGAQFGNECIAMLLKLMEDYKDKLIVVFAGYRDEMKKFQESNPGLISRIGYRIDFPDYTLEELTQIYLKLLEKNRLSISDEALVKFQNIINESSKNEYFGNGRYIHNAFQKILIEHAKNLENKGIKDNLYKIEEEDINYEKLISKNNKRKLGF